MNRRRYIKQMRIKITDENDMPKYVFDESLGLKEERETDGMEGR